jgi:signal transduction histidine kinase
VIEDQRRELERRVADSERLSRESRALKVRAERASSRLAELNESFLKRISAELHDGPAQLIGLAALRLASLGRSRNKEERQHELAVVDGALTEAIREIRNLCKGLSLPEIDGVPIGRTVERVVRSHEARTDTKVAVDVDMPTAVPHPVAISVFRFVQEGLNNAYRHADGAGQAVRGRIADGRLTLTVSNRLDGGSSGPAGPAVPRGLGLEGLRERVESLGGSFDFRIAPGRQAEMTMTIALDAEAFHV